MKHMERNNKVKSFFIDRASRIKRFFTHLPLFAKFLAIMTSLILISYFVLSTALVAFMSNHWTRTQRDALMDSVTTNAQYCERILENCQTESEIQSAMILICNNIGVAAKSTDTDMFLCDTDGSVIVCKEAFQNGYSFSGEMVCFSHRGYKMPPEVLKETDKGGYFENEKIQGLYSEKTFLAGAPVKINGKVYAYVFSAAPVQYSFKEYSKNIFNMYVWSALFSAALSFIVVYAFTEKLTNPLRQMSNATKAYAKGDFSRRVDVKGRDEFADLCQSFNRMASSLAVMESSRRSFVANVSHELKTPMTTIDGFINGMLDGTIPEEKRDEYLKIVSDEVGRLSRLVTSMLNLSKIEAGELELKLSDFDLSNTAVACLLTFEQMIEKKHIEIKGLENLEKTVVHGDSDMLYQVVYNLIDNAVKFTPDGGNIELSITKNNRGEVDFWIKNSGAGIPPEEIGRIFERFYKVDKSRSYDTRSAGLGLYLCKTIIEMHGGNIYVQSVQNEFTQFGFKLK